MSDLIGQVTLVNNQSLLRMFSEVTGLHLFGTRNGKGHLIRF